MTNAHSLRIFVSYSHDDSDLYLAVRSRLQANGFNVVSDTDLQAGQGFTEQIQSGISHAHVLLPILTPRSHARGWVHQEIGFAVALRIPYVPVCIGNLPDGMIAKAQGVVVNEKLVDLDQKLSAVDFKGLVEQAGRQAVPPCHVAHEPETRAKTIQEYADAAFYTIGAARIRIAGGLSTFSLPDEEPEHPKWLGAYGNRPRSPHSYELSRNERQALARHTTRGGLSMVINVGLDLDAHRGPGVSRTRLGLLREFLASPELSDDLTQIAVVRDHPDERLRELSAKPIHPQE